MGSWGRVDLRGKVLDTRKSKGGNYWEAEGLESREMRYLIIIIIGLFVVLFTEYWGFKDSMGQSY